MVKMLVIFILCAIFMKWNCYELKHSQYNLVIGWWMKFIITKYLCHKGFSVLLSVSLSCDILNYILRC